MYLYPFIFFNFLSSLITNSDEKPSRSGLRMRVDSCEGFELL